MELVAKREKQERAGAKAPLGERCAFFQPFEFRTVVGLKTVLNVIRYTPATQRLNHHETRSMQRRAILPAHGDAGLTDGCGGQPKIADRDEFVPGIHQWQPVAHPGHDALLLK